MIAYLSVKKNFLSQLIVVEYWALERVMKLGEELGLEKVDLEWDAQVIVQALNWEDTCFSWYGEQIEDAKVRLKSKPSWKIQFTHREGIEVAHVMARGGLTLKDDCNWIQQVPNCIFQIVMLDYSQYY